MHQPNPAVRSDSGPHGPLAGSRLEVPDLARLGTMIQIPRPTRLEPTRRRGDGGRGHGDSAEPGTGQWTYWSSGNLGNRAIEDGSDVNFQVLVSEEDELDR